MRTWKWPLDSELVTQPRTWRLPCQAALIQRVHAMVSLYIHGISFLHTVSRFPPLVTAICHTVHNRLVSWVGSEAPGISNVVYSVHVRYLARSLRNDQLGAASSSEDDLGILKLTFIENTAQNTNCPLPSGVQGRVACGTWEVRLCSTLIWITASSLERKERAIIKA